MSELRQFSVGAGQTYGPLPGGFSYSIREGFTALVGPNNAGKSSLLQFAFKSLISDAEFAQPRTTFIPADRAFVDPSIEVGGRTLEAWNGDFYNAVVNAPMAFGSIQGPSRSELTRVLLHDNLLRQVTQMNDLLPRFGLHPLDIAGGGIVEFQRLAVHVQGSGLRGILPILAAVTNPTVSALLIDEPELSLEPRLQKELRDILVEATATKRIVIVATHSHLMLNRPVVESTQVVTAEGGVTVRTLSAVEELFDLTFDLLGASTEDLFFPKNYAITEGSSDEAILNKSLKLVGQGESIKVLAAGGIGEVAPRAAAVERALVPLVVSDSPYARRVVALVDAPTESEVTTVERIRDILGDRLFVLDQPSIEAYIPADIYERAGRSRDDDLAELARLTGDREARNNLKREISNAVAAVLTAEDLDSIPIVRQAAEKAAEL